jgi:hypothetical protein
MSEQYLKIKWLIIMFLQTNGHGVPIFRPRMFPFSGLKLIGMKALDMMCQNLWNLPTGGITWLIMVNGG